MGDNCLNQGFQRGYAFKGRGLSHMRVYFKIFGYAHKDAA